MADEVKEQEVWKQCPKYPFIEASNLGRVRTKDRYVPSKGGGKRLIKGRVLKQQLHPCGYMYVSFRTNGKYFKLSVHRIIATCFIPNPDNLPEVNHRDCNPKNNVVSNLEWCTRQYNVAYREKYGTPASEALGCPVFAVNLETLEVLHFETQSEASRQLGVFRGHINNVLKGRLNKTHGYWFCCADENAIENVRTKFGDEVANEVEKLMV